MLHVQIFQRFTHLTSLPIYHFRFSIFDQETLKSECQCSRYLELNPTCVYGSVFHIALLHVCVELYKLQLPSLYTLWANPSFTRTNEWRIYLKEIIHVSNFLFRLLHIVSFSCVLEGGEGDETRRKIRSLKWILRSAN